MDNVLFGPIVGIYTSNHATDSWERTHGACYDKPVKTEIVFGLEPEYTSIRV